MDDLNNKAPVTSDASNASAVGTLKHLLQGEFREPVDEAFLRTLIGDTEELVERNQTTIRLPCDVDESFLRRLAGLPCVSERIQSPDDAPCTTVTEDGVGFSAQDEPIECNDEEPEQEPIGHSGPDEIAVPSPADEVPASQPTSEPDKPRVSRLRMFIVPVLIVILAVAALVVGFFLRGIWNGWDRAAAPTGVSPLPTQAASLEEGER